jgi:hypothetical protein
MADQDHRSQDDFDEERRSFVNLERRVSNWNEGDAAELEGIMADVSAWAETQFAWIAQIAMSPLLGTSGEALGGYESALCHVYAVRGFTVEEREQHLRDNFK